MTKRTEAKVLEAEREPEETPEAEPEMSPEVEPESEPSEVEPLTPDDAIQAVLADPAYEHHGAEGVEVRAVTALADAGWDQADAERAVRERLY